MLYNLIMTIVLTTGEYEINLIDNNLSKKQCDERSLVLSNIVADELNKNDYGVAFVNVNCVVMKQSNTPKYKQF